MAKNLTCVVRDTIGRGESAASALVNGGFAASTDKEPVKARKNDRVQRELASAPCNVQQRRLFPVTVFKQGQHNKVEYAVYAEARGGAHEHVSPANRRHRRRRRRYHRIQHKEHDSQRKISH